MLLKEFQKLLANKDEIAVDAVFSICIKHLSKARYRDFCNTF